MEVIIALDVGTQSLRAGLYNLTGEMLDCYTESYAPRFYPRNKVEQDPSIWEAALVSALSQVGDFLKGGKHEAIALGLTTQRASVIPLDAEGKPLHDAYMWQDKRAVKDCDYLFNQIGGNRLYEESGLRLDPYFSLPKILYYRRFHPERWEKTKKLVGVQDYINYLLTGKFVTDHSQASRTMLLNLHDLAWNEGVMAELDISRELFCDLVPPGSHSGGITPDFAEKTGLPVGLAVYLCGGDQQCASLGLGLTKPGEIMANTGTGSFVIGNAKEPAFDGKQRVLCSVAATPGAYVLEAGIYASGAMYNWCRDQFYAYGGEPTKFAEVNREVAAVAPGADGIVVLPHFQGSAAPYWNPIAKGVIFNLTLGSTKAQICRAILEAIAIEVEGNIRLVEKAGEVSECIYVAGGLTRFPVYCQILADCLGRPVIKKENAEATLTGALISTAVSLGIYPGYGEACGALLPEDCEVYEPIPENRLVYKRKRKLKHRLYQAINEGGVYKKAQDYFE